MIKANILEEFHLLDTREESGSLLEEERAKRTHLKHMFETKVREEDFVWKQRNRFIWIKEGNKNKKFFHGIALARMRRNIISTLQDGNTRLEDQEDTINHTLNYFTSLYAKEDWDMPVLDNLDFAMISEESASWLEREFEEEKVRKVVFNLGGDRAPGLDGTPFGVFSTLLGCSERGRNVIHAGIPC